MPRRLARILVCSAGAMMWGAPPALACDLPAGETATVASVVDGETLELTDGRMVRLIGIKAPSPPLDWKGGNPWPFAAEAKAALAKLTSGATVELHFDERRSDRYDHVLAQVYVVRGATKVWVQEALVGDGLARVYSWVDTRACVPELLAREGEARAGRRGIWHSLFYRVRDAGDVKRLGRLTRTYQLVEGTVHAVGEGRKWIYVNFAEDWRHDFTIAIARTDLAVFETAGFDFERLAGSRVRVRGFVAWWNGPMIKATHPEQIEILTPASPAG